MHMGAMPHMGVPNAIGGMPQMGMGMPMGQGMGGHMPYDSRRGDREDGDQQPQYRDSGRGGRGYSQQKHGRSERDGRGGSGNRDRRQPYYYSQQANYVGGGDSLTAGMGAMNLNANNLTQNLTQSSGPLTQASSTQLSQPMSQPGSLSALSQESYQGDDFYKSQSFVDPYM